MRKTILVLGLFLIVAFILGCTSQEQGPVCNKPYILVGTDCCLDQNDNGICDTDETAEMQRAETKSETEVEKECHYVEYDYSIEEINCDAWNIWFPAFVQYRINNWEYEDGEFNVWYGFRLKTGQLIGESKTVTIPARASVNVNYNYNDTIGGCLYEITAPQLEVCE